MKERKPLLVGTSLVMWVALLSGKGGGSCTLLQTAKVQVSSSDGTFVTAQLMFDNVADRSC